MIPKKTISTDTKLLLDGYVKDILAGKIVACKKVKQACRRHLNDLKRQGTDDFPYVFNHDRAYHPIGFIEKFCKPSKGNFKRLKLLPWQHFVIGSLYGWVHRDTGYRRFIEGLIFIGKKNGKSAIVSGLSLYGASKDGEKGADIYILANSMKQARKTIYEESQKMVKASPILRKRFRVLRDAIYYDKTNSTIEPQASDSEKLDGLNCHLGLFDEIHEYKNYKLINTIKGSTDAREQPLILHMTTAGTVLEGPLMDYYERGADVLEGVIENDRTFFYMAELDEDDDIEDPNNWIKANPSLGVTIKLERLIQTWNTVKKTPAERNNFITKKLNVFVQSDEQSFVTWDIILRNDKNIIDIERLKGCQCIGGHDLSNTEDFTSACLEFPLDDNQVFVLSHSWIPQKKVELEQEDLPYKEWEREGLLTICKGEYVRHEDVYDWYLEQCRRYSVSLITYDPAKAFRLTKALQDYGGEEWTKVVRQGALTLSPPLGDIKELLLDGNVIWNYRRPDGTECHNKLFRWYLNNTKVVVVDRNGNELLQKQGRYRKIDGVAAWLTSHSETIKIINMAKEQGGVSFVSIKDLLKAGD